MSADREHQPVAEPLIERLLDDDEQLVPADVPVPDELALHLDDADVVVVDLGQDPRAPQLVERRER